MMLNLIIRPQIARSGRKLNAIRNCERWIERNDDDDHDRPYETALHARYDRFTIYNMCIERLYIL